MKILIVGAHSVKFPDTDHMQHYVDFFTKAAGENGTAEYCSLDELVFWITSDKLEVINSRSGLPLEAYDTIVLRGRLAPYMMLAEAACLYAEHKKVQYFNDYSRFATNSKLAQAVTMHTEGLAIPSTLVCDNPAELVRQAAQRLSYPLIAKDAFGSHGANNFLVKNEAELRTILQKHAKVTFVLQEFIPNDCDYRVLIAGNKELIIRRQALTGSHLNNTSQGGKATLVASSDFPQEVLAQAHALARTLHLSLTGIDIMQHKGDGRMFFLEVNIKPQLMSGAFLDEKVQLMADFLADRP